MPIQPFSETEPMWMLKVALEINPPLIEPNETRLFERLNTVRNLVYYDIQVSAATRLKDLCNLTYVVDQDSAPVLLAFAFQKGSKLKEKLNEAILSMAPFVACIESKYARYVQEQSNCSPHTPTLHPALQMGHYFYLIRLCLSGLIISSVVLLIEILWARFIVRV